MIIVHPNPLLREKSVQIHHDLDLSRSIGENVGKCASAFSSEIVSEMIKAAEDSCLPWRGIAAVQIGRLLRVIAMKMSTDFRVEILIDPKITSSSDDETVSIEGCLSVRDVYVTRPRKRSVTVKYVDVWGFLKEKKYDGVDSIIVQHEIDHLDGRLIVDD